MLRSPRGCRRDRLLSPHLLLYCTDIGLADGCSGIEGNRCRDARRLAHRHAGRDFAAGLLCLRCCRIMPAGDDQLIDLLRQHRPVGRVVVAAAADRIGEVTARHDVVLGDDVSAFQLSRLAHAGLRCEIDDIGILEARHLLAGKFEQFCNARAAFDLGLGQILDFQPAQRRHMRAVQPDDARQRGFQPPEGPATADQPLCLVIEHLEGFGFLPFETLRCFGVDAAPARNRRQDEIGFDMRSAGAGGHIQIACRVDDDVAENGLHALLRLADHALDRSILDDCRGEPAMEF